MRGFRCVILFAVLLPLLQGAAPATRPATQPAAGLPVGLYDNKPVGFRASDTARGAARADRAAGESSFGYTRWILSLGVVLGLIFAARYAGKHLMGLQPNTGGGAINVLCRQNLAPRQQLLLVQVGRRVVLVASAGSQMNTLAEISDSDEIAEIMAQANRRRVSAAASFGSLFGKAADAYEARAEEAAVVQPREDAPAGAELSAARNELSNLLQKVRLVSSVAKRS